MVHAAPTGGLRDVGLLDDLFANHSKRLVTDAGFYLCLNLCPEHGVEDSVFGMVVYFHADASHLAVNTIEQREIELAGSAHPNPDKEVFFD